MLLSAISQGGWLSYSVTILDRFHCTIFMYVCLIYTRLCIACCVQMCMHELYSVFHRVYE